MKLTKQQLADLKADYIKWHAANWCSRSDADFDPTDEDACPGGADCTCYGMNSGESSFDEIDEAIITPDAVMIVYGDRQLILPIENDGPPIHESNDALPLFNRRQPGEPFIRSGDLEWVGDDVDYYGPFVYWLHDKFPMEG